MFKSKTNPNLEELDLNFIHRYISNKSSLEGDSSVSMGDNNNTLDMANDKGRSIREYTVFDSTTLHTSIVKLEVTTAQFDFKPIMFQMLQTIGKFSGVVIYDPYLHLNQFIEVAENFKIPCIEDVGLELRLFPYSLT